MAQSAQLYVTTGIKAAQGPPQQPVLVTGLWDMHHKVIVAAVQALLPCPSASVEERPGIHPNIRLGGT